MSNPVKKYKIVKNIDQYAGFKVPEEYVPLIKEITIDIRDVLIIILSYPRLFHHVKAYFISQLPPEIPLIKGFIEDINFNTVNKRVRSDDILPRIGNLLKQLLKINLGRKVLENDVKELTKEFISLVGFIIDAGVKASLLNTFLVGWMPVQANSSFSFNLVDYYDRIYPKIPQEKEEFKDI